MSSKGTDGSEEFITDEVVRKNAGAHAEAVRWLRAGLKDQGRYLRRSRDSAFFWSFASQIAVIVLGFVASLAAIFSQKGGLEFMFGAEHWSIVNIVVPLVISSLSGALAALDYRGAFARYSAAFNVISSVKAEVDYSILLGGGIDSTKLDEWNHKVGAAMLEHSTDWMRTLTANQKKD